MANRTDPRENPDYLAFALAGRRWWASQDDMATMLAGGQPKSEVYYLGVSLGDPDRRNAVPYPLECAPGSCMGTKLARLVRANVEVCEGFLRVARLQAVEQALDNAWAILTLTNIDLSQETNTETLHAAEAWLSRSKRAVSQLRRNAEGEGDQ